MVRICSLIALGIVLVTSPAVAAPPLLVVSGEGGNPEILLHVEGKEPQNLTKQPSNDVFPAWSPDGTKIAFASNRNGPINIWLMDADGSNAHALTAEPPNRGACHCPTWSPEGDRLAYQRRVGDRSELIIFSLSGDDPKMIADNAWDPSWSPRGDKIAFTSLVDGGWGLFTIEPDGGKLKRIGQATNRVGFVYPAWSPDGKQIAFTAQAGEGHEIHVCDADGSNLKPLTKEGRVSTHSVWAPDGKSIYFAHDVDGSRWDWRRVTLATGKVEPVEELPRGGYIHGGRIAWQIPAKEGGDR